MAGSPAREGREAAEWFDTDMIASPNGVVARYITQRLDDIRLKSWCGKSRSNPMLQGMREAARRLHPSANDGDCGRTCGFPIVCRTVRTDRERFGRAGYTVRIARRRGSRRSDSQFSYHQDCGTTT